MNNRPPLVLRIEAAFAALTGFLCLLTLVWRDWIERVFGVDPDHHDGSLEWLIVAALFVATVAFAVRARRHWRRWRAATAGAHG